MFIYNAAPSDEMLLLSCFWWIRILIEWLLNEKRWVVKEPYENVTDAEIITASNICKRVFISRIISHFVLRRQCSVIFATDLVIIKYEIHSFDHVGICLLNRVFGRGHIYIAMTKGRNCQNVGRLSEEVQNQVNVSQAKKHEKVCIYIYIYWRIH